MPDPYEIDLDADAAKREAAHPEGIPVRHGGRTFLLPAELPADVLEPLLSVDLDLASVVASAADVARRAEGADERAVGMEVVLDALLSRPTLPIDALRAARACLERLFGPEQWASWLETRPSLPAYGRLIRHLVRTYGVSLGEAFGSPAPSGAGGATSRPTSPPPTGSTPEASGNGRANPVSSASVG